MNIMRFFWSVSFLCSLGLSKAALAAEPRIVELTSSMALFPRGAEVRELASDLVFTEGPVWVGDRKGHLIFSDIPANKLYRWDEDQGLSVFRDPSQKVNGNSLDLQGRLLSCEHWGRKVSLTTVDGSSLPVVTEFQGKQLNSPNDILMKSDGSIWFTDPDYGLEGRTKEQEGNFVYRLDPLTNRLNPVVKDFVKPNGLCFSPDESILYVADSGTPRHIRSFPVLPDGTLGEGSVFAAIDKGGPDGIRCDRHGNVWSSSGDGVQVFNASGSLMARVLLPKGAANLCFGGADGRTLFITARNYLFSVETLVTDAATHLRSNARQPAQAPRSAMAHPDSSGWESLFDEDLSNAIYPEGIWTSEDGVFTASEDQSLWTQRDYENFVLDLEFKNGPEANSGVVVYCTDLENWIPNSVEIQIADDHAEKWAKSPASWQCGAVFGHLPASASYVNKPGEWNRYTIRCAGQQIDIVLNGQHVTSMDMSLWTSAKTNPDGSEIPSWLNNPFSTLPTKGRIGFQGKHGGAPIWFRNIRIKEL